MDTFHLSSDVYSFDAQLSKIHPLDREDTEITLKQLLTNSYFGSPAFVFKLSVPRTEDNLQYLTYAHMIGERIRAFPDILNNTNFCRDAALVLPNRLTSKDTKHPMEIPRRLSKPAIQLYHKYNIPCILALEDTGREDYIKFRLTTSSVLYADA